VAPLRRRLIFALLAIGLGFVLLEGVAWTWERLTWVVDRSYPLAGPGTFLEFNRAAAETRQQLEEGGTPMIEDPRTGWGLAPNTVSTNRGATFRINSLGLRGPEVGPKAAGEIRLVSLGDSSVYGDGVPEDDVFVNVAADLLGHVWERPVTGIIGAVPGHDTHQSLALLDKVGSTLQSDWVVVANLWSDLFMDQGFHRRFTDRADDVKGPLRYLALYRVLRRGLAPWLRAREVNFLSSRSDLGELEGEKRSRVRLAEYVQNLGRLTEKIEALGARPAFLILPAPMDLDAVPPPEAVFVYREAMRQAAARSDAPLLDGPQLFEERGANIGYWTDQVHPDRPGHLLLGEGLASVLRDRGP